MIALAVLVFALLTVPVSPALGATRQAQAEATPRSFRPCPTVQVSRPSRPPAPSPDPHSVAAGGPTLNTRGLAIPDGVPTPPAITATSWLVADLDTGAVLGACGAHERATPASVQKLLLAAAMLPRLDPNQEVEVTEEDMDFEPGSSAMGLVRGGRYRVETLWLGLMLNSGNDAANTLARLGGGSIAEGVKAMNAEARRLGAFSTHAATPSGLDGPGQYTTAYDLALIARACFAREDFRRYAMTRTAQVPAQPHVGAKGFAMQNDNPLITEYPGALGGKTGYTDLARHTYVGAAERDGRRLVVTLLGAEAHPLRGWQQGAKLLDWGFSLPRDASVGRLITPEEAAELASPKPTPTATESPYPLHADTASDPQAVALRNGIVISVVAVLLLGLLATTWWRVRRHE